MRIDLGVFNLLDETYWQWSAVRNRPADDPMIGALLGTGPLWLGDGARGFLGDLR